jgi:hypothetical protein
MFELTMLGAVVATVVTILVTASLLHTRPSFYETEVADGRILVGVERWSVPPERLIEALEAVGGLVERQPER